MDWLKKAWKAGADVIGEVPMAIVVLGVSIGALKVATALINKLAPGWGDKIRGWYRI